MLLYTALYIIVLCLAIPIEVLRLFPSLSGHIVMFSVLKMSDFSWLKIKNFHYMNFLNMVIVNIVNIFKEMLMS